MAEFVFAAARTLGIGMPGLSLEHYYVLVNGGSDYWGRPVETLK
jgi:hypothetical protein